MFNLGNKEAIVNNISQYPININGTLMEIEKFGRFDQAKVLRSAGQRFISGSPGTVTVTIPGAADMGIDASAKRVLVTFRFRANTDRYAAEWAIDYIKDSRPFIFELLLDGSDDADTVLAKIVAAFQKYEEMFNQSDRGLPFQWDASASPALTLTALNNYVSFNSNFEFLVGSNLNPYVAVASANTKAVQPVFDGKYLEENVRMSLPATSDMYSIKTNQELPVLGRGYTSVTWWMQDTTDEGIGGAGQAAKHKFLGKTRGERGGNREFQFTLYFTENGDAFGAGGPLSQLVDFLIAGSGSNYEFLLADGTPVTTGDAFVA